MYPLELAFPELLLFPLLLLLLLLPFPGLGFLFAFAISSSLLSIAALSFSNCAKSACKSFASPAKSFIYFCFSCFVAFSSCVFIFFSFFKLSTCVL